MEGSPENESSYLVTLCAIAGIVFGIVWLFLRKDTLLFIVLGLSAFYLIGKNFGELRDKRFLWVE